MTLDKVLKWFYQYNFFEKEWYFGTDSASGLRKRGFSIQTDFYLGPQMCFEMELNGITDKSWLCGRISILGLLGFHLIWTKKQSHAGIYLNVCIFFFRIIAELRDMRHWDYEKNAFKPYGEF